MIFKGAFGLIQKPETQKVYTIQETADLLDASCDEVRKIIGYRNIKHQVIRTRQSRAIMLDHDAVKLIKEFHDAKVKKREEAAKHAENEKQKHEEEAKRDSENSQSDSSEEKDENGFDGDQDDGGTTSDDGSDNGGSAKSGQTDSGEQDRYSDTDDDDEEDNGEGAKKPKNPIEALKRLYRKIVKRLHPDVNQNLTEREKELFNEATAAYQAGDLEKMQAIWEELESGTDPEERFEDTPEDLNKLREMLAKLKVRVRELSSEISHIRSEYPYTMKEFLEDEEVVEAKRSELQKQLQEIRDADAKLAEFIELVKKKVKDPWNN